MHYYKKNIGDYAKKAGRLSMLEHGAYTLLMDACYDREDFPTEREAIDWCWARSPEEVAAVQFILSRFFECIDGKYVQKRIQEEINRYHDTAEINSRIATEREANRTKRAKESTKRERSVNGASTVEDESCTNEHEAPPNHKPITINQEPRTKNQKQKQKPAVANDPAFDRFWESYPVKKNKFQAMKAWQRAGIGDSLERVLAVLAIQVGACRDLNYFAHASTWLNNRRWEDESSKQPAQEIVGGFTSSMFIN